MNIDTPEGMAEAKEWLEFFVSIISPGGCWIVPRSMAIYEIHHAKKIALRRAMPDHATERVFAALGWSVLDEMPVQQ